MPLVIAKRGVDELAVVYFILVILTGGALLIELRWRWPRVQLALSAWVVIGTLALAFLFVDNSLSACGPYFTAQPNLRFYAFFDYLFADLQVGFLLFLGAGIADTVFGTRRWWQQRRAR